MTESLKRAVHQALLRMLVPLASLLLELGIGIGDFLSVAKLAYVRAARSQSKDATGAMLRPNATRIAVVTGLTRKDVASILAAGDDEPAVSHRGRHRAERVLSGWWNDPEFQDEFGRAAVLPEQGSAKSFAALCERYSGDPRFSAILDELIRVQAVKQLADGRVAALSRSYATVRWDPDGVLELGEELAEHCQTLLHNLKNPTRPRISRRIFNAQLNPRYAPMLIRDLEAQLTTFGESVDDALNAPQYTVKADAEVDAVKLGIGFYLFEGDGEAPTANQRTQSPSRGRRKKRKKQDRGTPD
jgi:Family of unknown function (DUF6502)